MYICIYVYMYICIYVYMYICIHIHPAAVETAPAVVVFFEKNVAVAIAPWTFYVRIGGRFSRGILISNSHMQWFLQGKVFKKCACFYVVSWVVLC